MAATAVQWELWGANFRENIANLWVSCYDGNNDRSARVSLRWGFDCIIRPAPSGAGRRTPSQPGHYPLNNDNGGNDEDDDDDHDDDNNDICNNNRDNNYHNNHDNDISYDLFSF